MSFLNPVNEPVLRFSSTDTDAPQINYAARTAGDIKTVLKACLVTGYGSKASAGWSVVNEVDNVCEFVSPSAAMSDYRLGVDDTSASSTTWYYQYQNARINPANNKPKKTVAGVSNANASNGWQLFVTARGVLFVEIMYITAISELSARITYWGQVKSAIITASGPNIAFLCVGNGSNIQYTNQFFTQSDTTYKHYRVGGYTSVTLSAANISNSPTDNLFDDRDVNLTSPLYIYSGRVFLGVQPAFTHKAVNKQTELYGVYDGAFNSRPVLHVCVGIEATNLSFIENASRAILVYLDYWEY